MPKTLIEPEAVSLPAEAVLVCVGQALRLLKKGIAPEYPERLADESGNAWIASIDYGNRAIKLFRHSRSDKDEKVVDGWVFPASMLGDTELEMLPIVKNGVSVE